MDVPITSHPEEIYWNASEYSRNSTQQKMVADKLLEQITFRGDEKILDVGCGDGKITRQVAENYPLSQVIGVDPSHEMIQFANQNKKGENVSFILGSASKLVFENEFDVITSFSALHWEPSQKEALHCFKRALKPGGKIILAIPGPDFLLRDALQITCNETKWHPLFAHFSSPGKIWSVEEYRQLLNEANFNIQKIEQIERIHYFSSPQEYQGFIGAMLPHMSVVPQEKKPDFLNEIMSTLYQLGYFQENQPIPFQVQVIEVIANKPK